MSLGETTDLEKTSLEAHVDLCAMRYAQLDTRLTMLELMMASIQKEIADGQKSLKTTLITSATTIVGSIIAVVITVLMKF